MAADMGDLDKVQKSRNSFLVYAHGVWTTANCRRMLWRLTQAFGDGVIYNDTDSVKGLEPNFAAIEEYNKDVIRKDIERNAFYDSKDGVRYYLGIAEHETKDAPYEQFKTLGAKKYCYIQEGALHITISGVSKSGAREMRGIEDFHPGFIFHENAGLSMWYNDAADIVEMKLADGSSTLVGANIGSLPSTYEIGVTDEYESLLSLYEK